MTTEQEQRTIADFIADRPGLTMTAERVTADAWRAMVPADKEWRNQPDRTYWVLTAKNTATQDRMSVPYSAGSAAWWKLRGPAMHRREGEANYARCHTDGGAWPCAEVLRMSWTVEECKPTPPSLADFLDCLASDAGSYDNARDFSDWCGEYGYDDDSRTAERTYNMIAEQSRNLRRLLGADSYRELTENTERL